MLYYWWGCRRNLNLITRSHSGSPLAVPAAFASGGHPSETGHVLRYARKVTMATACPALFIPTENSRQHPAHFSGLSSTLLSLNKRPPAIAAAGLLLGGSPSRAEHAAGAERLARFILAVAVGWNFKRPLDKAFRLSFPAREEDFRAAWRRKAPAVSGQRDVCWSLASNAWQADGPDEFVELDWPREFHQSDIVGVSPHPVVRVNVDPGGRDYLVGAFHVARYVASGFYCVPEGNRENSEPCLKLFQLAEGWWEGRGGGSVRGGGVVHPPGCWVDDRCPGAGVETMRRRHGPLLPNQRATADRTGAICNKKFSQSLKGKRYTWRREILQILSPSLSLSLSLSCKWVILSIAESIDSTWTHGPSGSQSATASLLSSLCRCESHSVPAHWCRIPRGLGKSTVSTLPMSWFTNTGPIWVSHQFLLQPFHSQAQKSTFSQPLKRNV